MSDRYLQWVTPGEVPDYDKAEVIEEGIYCHYQGVYFTSTDRVGCGCSDFGQKFFGHRPAVVVPLDGVRGGNQR